MEFTAQFILRKEELEFINVPRKENVLRRLFFNLLECINFIFSPFDLKSDTGPFPLVGRTVTVVFSDRGINIGLADADRHFQRRDLDKVKQEGDRIDFQTRDGAKFFIPRRAVKTDRDWQSLLLFKRGEAE